MVQEVSAPRDADAGAGRSTADPDPVAGPPPAAPPGPVPLDRLLGVVVLSPAQASLVAARLLDGTHEGRVDLWRVGLTASGEVEVTPARPGAGAPVGRLLEQLTRNARRLPAHPSADQLALLSRLEDVVATADREPAARARELEAGLVEVGDPDPVPRLTAQLAALVDAFDHIASSLAPTAAPTAATLADPTPAAAPQGAHAEPTPPTAPRFTPGRPPWRGAARRRPRARRAVPAVLLLVAALAGSGWVLLRSPDDGSAADGGRDSRASAPRTTRPSDSSTAPAERPAARPRPRVETIAPRQAGAVTGVQVQKAGACGPGALCAVTVTTRLSPAPTARPVTWRVGTVRSCGGEVAWSAPVSVTAQPGWTRVFASSSVPVPQGRTLAIVAVASAPARVQSPPVPVTGSSLRC